MTLAHTLTRIERQVLQLQRDSSPYTPEDMIRIRQIREDVEGLYILARFSAGGIQEAKQKEGRPR